MLAEFGTTTEEALWSAIRAMEENILFVKSLARHSTNKHHGVNTASWLKKACEVQARVDLVRKALPRGVNGNVSKSNGKVLEEPSTTTVR
jgi:hypothetical protein